MNNDFNSILNGVLAQNNNSNDNNSNFRPTRIGQKTPFLGRVLPLDNGQFPFVMYSVAWISYTKKDGSVIPLQVILDPNNQEDKLAHILNRAIEYNKQHREGNSGPDVIKLGSGKYPLRIAKRATFLGVKVGEQNGKWGQAMDNQGHPVVEAFDTSFSAMQAIAELLKPDVPYMYNGQPLFNTPAQFITTGATYPVSLKFVQQPGGGVGNWSATVQQVLLPQMNFDYLEKDQNGNYKYVDDIVKERQPLLVSNPQFYEQVLNSVSEAYQQQLNAGATNPYVGNDDLPFSDSTVNQGQTDVVQGMTGEPAGNFTQPNQNTQPTAPAPANAPMNSVPANNAFNTPSQPSQGNVDNNQSTTSASSQTGSQAPQTPNDDSSNPMDMAFDLSGDVNNFISNLNKQ